MSIRAARTPHHYITGLPLKNLIEWRTDQLSAAGLSLVSLHPPRSQIPPRRHTSLPLPSHSLPTPLRRHPAGPKTSWTGSVNVTGIGIMLTGRGTLLATIGQVLDERAASAGYESGRKGRTSRSKGRGATCSPSEPGVHYEGMRRELTRFRLSHLQGRLRELEAALTLRPPSSHFGHPFNGDPSGYPPGPEPHWDPSDPYGPPGPPHPYGPGPSHGAYPGDPGHPDGGHIPGLSPFLRSGSASGSIPPSGQGRAPASSYPRRPSLSPSTSHPSHHSHSQSQHRSSPHHRAPSAGVEPLTGQSASSTPGGEREKAHLHGPMKVLQDLGADEGFNAENNDPVGRHILTIGEAKVACRL